MDEIIGDSKSVQPAKKGRRAAAAAMATQPAKESSKESSTFRDDTEDSIDTFDSRKYSPSANQSSQKPSTKLGSWGADGPAAGDYEDERLRARSPVDDDDDDSDADIPSIPELEADIILTTRGAETAPHVAVNRVATFMELDTDLLRHTSFLSLKSQDGSDIDLKLLGDALSGESNLVEEDVPWEWEQIFTEVSSELLTEWEQQEAPEE